MYEVQHPNRKPARWPHELGHPIFPAETLAVSRIQSQLSQGGKAATWEEATKYAAEQAPPDDPVTSYADRRGF